MSLSLNIECCGASSSAAAWVPFQLNEFSSRFNNRKNDNLFADLITTCSQ